jgi:hypothetical protein
MHHHPHRTVLHIQHLTFHHFQISQTLIRNNPIGFQNVLLTSKFFVL